MKKPQVYAEESSSADKAVAALMHDFIMLLCQADYEGRPTISIVDEILKALEDEPDPRQLALKF